MINLQALRVNGDRLWSSLMEHAKIGAREDGGICREALTDSDKKGRDLFAAWCREAGMEIAVDQLGNMFATLPGRGKGLRAISCGSHLDTQPCGGKFDGVLGVLAGLEVIRTLRDNGVEPIHPITLINWTAEEGSRFAPSMAASGVYAGVMPVSDADEWVDRDGVRFFEALQRIGYDGSEPVGMRKLSAYLELHIEQGPVLESWNKSIGIVVGAQAMRCYSIQIKGVEAHAGTTPMERRLDPVSAFNRIYSSCESRARSIPDARFTVGLINTSPGSHSVIPSELSFLLDIRHPQDERVLELFAFCQNSFSAERELGYQISCDEIWSSPAVSFDPICVEAVRQAVRTCGYSFADIVSGAGHDAVYVARVCPTAMIFTPCENGVSHNPAESITLDDARRGADVLLQAILELDHKEST